VVLDETTKDVMSEMFDYFRLSGGVMSTFPSNQKVSQEIEEEQLISSTLDLE
jgi:hypothetical protein